MPRPRAKAVSSIRRAFAATQLLVKADRTADELAALLGCDRQQAYRYINAARDEGLVRVAGTRERPMSADGVIVGGVRPNVWHWTGADA